MNTEILVTIITVWGLIIAALLGLVPACLDSKRAKRERLIAERERIRDAAMKLLRHLANFRHLEQEDQKLAAGLSSHQQVTAEMRGAYDAWALTVMPRLNDAHQNRAREIRKKELGRDNLKNTEAKDISISNEIFELTWTASENVR